MSDEGFDENTLELGEWEGKEEECSVESDRKTTLFSSSNKRNNKMPIDKLSVLPDSLLVRILSFLYMKEAVRTSVLSKRWKFLWAELPRLDFWNISIETEKTLEFVSWVSRTIDIRKANYLDAFLVAFEYNKCFASDIDAWVEFSVKNEVKVFFLWFCAWFVDYYTLPQVMYSCSSFTALHLSGCIMAYERTIGWQSLTDLTLSHVKLNQHLLDEILTSCPVLSSLELEGCWGFTRLEVNSRCLNTLRIEEPENEPFLEIIAPYVPSLYITVFPERRKWQLKNVSSVVRASINLFEFDCGCTEEVMSNVMEFLEKFKHVKEIYVARQCFEVLSIMAANGWQFHKFRLRNLTLLSTSEYEHNISGIIGMLKSSPNIETLLLEGYDTQGIVLNLDAAGNDDLDGDLLHLKKIRVNNFADPNGEPLLTLARILLRRAPALEEMMIVIDVEETNDFVYIAQTLLTYPRSSPKAEIHLISSK